jgi:hypothetical protein
MRLAAVAAPSRLQLHIVAPLICSFVCVVSDLLPQVSAHEARRAGGSKAADKGKGKGPAGLSSGPFYSELEAEVRFASSQVMHWTG